MERVIFDGVDLTALYDVTSERGIATPKVKTEEVPGRDGSIVTDVTYSSPTVRLNVISKQAPREVRADMRELSGLFAVREPRPLQFSGDDGRYYMALPSDLDWSEFVTSGRLKVEFTVPEVAMYGREVGVTVPSGGSLTLRVGGTHPTALRATATVQRDSSTHMWGLRLDEGDYIHVNVPTSADSVITVDGARRVCTVDGDVVVPTLDSDWLTLEPGVHTLRNDLGSGAVDVTWTERWL
jgi:predicted phage tail component-like protein